MLHIHNEEQWENTLPQCRAFCGSQLPANECWPNGGGIPMWSTHCRRPESNSVSLLHIPGIFLVRCVGAASMPIINLPLMPDLARRSERKIRIHTCMYGQDGCIFVSGICGSGGWRVWISWTAKATPTKKRQSPWGAWLWLQLMHTGHLWVVTAAKWLKTSEKLQLPIAFAELSHNTNAPGPRPSPGESAAHARVCDRFADYFGDRFSFSPRYNLNDTHSRMAFL